MAFGDLTRSGANAPLAEINMVPLIDVMMVLLVIFIITAPLLTHAVKIELPKASSAPVEMKPDHVRVAIKADGRVYWNGEAVDDARLAEHIETAAREERQPALHIRADRKTPYEKVAQVMAAAARAGLSKIGFVTEPEKTK